MIEVDIRTECALLFLFPYSVICNELRFTFPGLVQPKKLKKWKKYLT